MAACKLGRFEREMAACKLDCLKIWNFKEGAACKLGGLGGLHASKFRLGTLNRELELAKSCLQTWLPANLFVPKAPVGARRPGGKPGALTVGVQPSTLLMSSLLPLLPLLAQLPNCLCCSCCSSC